MKDKSKRFRPCDCVFVTTHRVFPERILVCLIYHGRKIAYVGLEKASIAPYTHYVTYVHVNTSWRKKGVATELYRYLSENLHLVFNGGINTNPVSQRLWEKHLHLQQSVSCLLSQKGS